MTIIVKNNKGEIIKELPGDISKTILEQLEEAGVDIYGSCLSGMCSTCSCELEQGNENVNRSFVGEEAWPLEDNQVMTCISSIKDEKKDIILKLY